MGVLDAIRERKRQDTINRALRGAYEEATPDTSKIVFDDEGPAGDVSREFVTPGKPGGLNFNNAIAALYKAGYGTDAMALEQQREQNELAKLLKTAQAQKSLQPEYTSSQKDLLAAGIKPGTQEWSDSLRLHVIGPQIQAANNASAAERRHQEDVSLRKQDKIDKGVTDLSKRLEDVAALRSSVASLNDQLSNYSPKADVPGVGYGKTIPGAEFFLTPEGKRTRSMIQGVANDLLKLYSGGAVTPQENERRMVEMMASGNYTPEDLYNALPLVIGRVNDITGNIMAGYDADVQNKYKTRPGAIKTDPILPTKGKELTAPIGATKKHKLGDIVEVRGKKYRIIKLNPDGDHDVALVQ